jgi:hypothetical protein
LDFIEVVGEAVSGKGYSAFSGNVQTGQKAELIL